MNAWLQFLEFLSTFDAIMWVGIFLLIDILWPKER